MAFFDDLEEDEIEVTHRPKTKNKTYQNTGRKGFNMEEVKELKEIFAKYFKKGQRPQPCAIHKGMRKSEARNGLIHKRSQSSLKNKIYRMIDNGE